MVFFCSLQILAVVGFVHFMKTCDKFGLGNDGGGVQASHTSIWLGHGLFVVKCYLGQPLSVVFLGTDYAGNLCFHSQWKTFKNRVRIFFQAWKNENLLFSSVAENLRFNI